MVRACQGTSWVASAIVALSACGKTENDWPVTPVPEYSYADFARSLPSYLCERWMRCPLARNYELASRALFQDVERCADVLGAALKRSSKNFDPTDAIAHGRILFDGDKAHAYLDSLTGPCDSSGTRIDPFRGGALEGTVKAGAPCASFVECTKGNYCDHTAGACPGTCTEQESNGSPCQGDRECASNFCGTGGTCEALTMHPPAPAGEACGFQASPTPTRTECSEGLWCQGSPTGTCRTPIPANAPCTSQDDPCVIGHLCLTDVDGAKRCRPISVAVEGERCSGENRPDVRLCDEFSFLSCSGDVCVAQASGSEGSSCVRTDFVDGCDAGFYCASQQNVCVRLKNAGEPCTGTEACASGYCIFGTMTCSDTLCD